MVKTETFRSIIGIIGNVISFGLFLSPVPTFLKIIKNKAVDDYSPWPYIATVLNCALWVFYGMPFVHPHSLLVVTTNSIGLVLELVYLLIFYTYAAGQKNGRKKVVIGLGIEIVFVAVIVVITMLTLHTHEKRSMMVGIICDFFNIMMYVSPLTAMKQVITTKSVKYMPIHLLLACFLNACIWTSYSLIKFDIYVLVCNGIGTVTAVAQLILYGVYYRKTPKDDDIYNVRKNPSEVQLSNV